MKATYDCLCILPDELKDDAREAAIARIQEEAQRLDGDVLGIARIGRRTFARPMQKRAAGFYANVRMSLDPSQVDALAARFHLMDDLFRFQFLRDVKRPGAATESPEAPETADQAPEPAAESADAPTPSPQEPSDGVPQ